MTKCAVRLGRVALIALLAVACGGPAATPTQTPPAAPPTAVPPSVTQGAPEATAAVASQQASPGMAVYTRSCSRCHGDSLAGGSATALSRATLARYGTAQKLFEYIRQTMPKGNAGGLTEEEYYDVAAYLLVQQGLLAIGQPVNRDSAGGIILSE